MCDWCRLVSADAGERYSHGYSRLLPRGRIICGLGRPPKAKRVTTADGSFTVNGKAANGEGSLYRERDGWWRATFRVPGESRRRRVRGRTREEALRRRGEALTRALAEAPRPPATTMMSASTTLTEL